MAAVNLINPALMGASPEAVRTASAMGLLSKPAPALTSAARTGNWSPPVIPAGATPEEAARLQSINRQGMTAASQYKAPAAPTKKKAPASKKTATAAPAPTNPSNLGYSQSYDPKGRGYRPISTISPQTAASLRAKFGTPSNLG